METTYLIRNSTTNTIIASNLPRVEALDLLEMLMAWNKGIQAWTVQVDYCEEECNKPIPSAVDILAAAPNDVEIFTDLYLSNKRTKVKEEK